MVKIDLRSLSAPIEALRPEVQAAYERIDEQWTKIIAQLKKLPIPCTVGYTYAEHEQNPFDYMRLEFGKLSGKKRIWIADYSYIETDNGPDSTVSTTPYEEWSGEQRVEMLEHVPGLFSAAAKGTKDFIEKTKFDGGSK